MVSRKFFSHRKEKCDHYSKCYKFDIQYRGNMIFREKIIIIQYEKCSFTTFSWDVIF